MMIHDLPLFSYFSTSPFFRGDLNCPYYGDHWNAWSMVMLSDLAFIVHRLGWCHQMSPVDIDAQSMEGQSNNVAKTSKY